MNKKIKIQDYTLVIGEYLLQDFPKYLPKDLRNHSFVIVTNTRVKTQFLDLLHQALAENHIQADLIIIKDGEQYKNRETKAEIESILIKRGHGRKTCLIALGGGVIGDLTGFVAATYMRGIPYIQVPTTLLSMVDSSVGGKTGINTPEGKNLIGSFWNPRAVIADLNCLHTLPKRHLVNGWIEALKIFITSDQAAFKKAVKLGQPTPALIQQAIVLKSKIVTADPHEQSLRAILNFGHTMAHALETVSNYQLLHGYAVAYGILLEAQISLQRGLITDAIFEQIQDAFQQQGIRTKTLRSYDIHEIIQQARRDKKNLNPDIRLVLLSGLGSVYQTEDQYTHPVTDRELIQAFHTLTDGGRHAR